VYHGLYSVRVLGEPLIAALGPALSFAASVMNKIPDPDRPTRQAKRAAALLTKLTRTARRKRTPALVARRAGCELEFYWLMARIKDDAPEVPFEEIAASYHRRSGSE
jgi:hypothetical protein